MGKYSEKQLLMLSNFVYLPGSVSNDSLKNIINSYKDEDGNITRESIQKAGVGGGLSDEEVCMLFNEMDEEMNKDPSFGDISASRILDGGNVRAICYTDSKDKNPVIAFRGTGGSAQAWSDNFEGGYQSDSRLQTLAKDFVADECEMYSGVTVTGHSKGGNLSQYVTVMCSDQIDSCVSFDGQGFNKTFIEENKDKIATASSKIKSVAAYNDYVNILLTSIAGTVLYANNGSSVADAHSSFSLLKNNEYDQEGNIISSKQQSSVAKCLKGLTDRIVGILDTKDVADKEILSHVAGASIATALSGDFEAIKSVPGNIASGVTAVFAKKLIELEVDSSMEIHPQTLEVYLNYTDAKKAESDLLEVKEEINGCIEKIYEMADSIAIKMQSKVVLENKIRNIGENMTALSKKLDGTIAIYEEVLNYYNMGENEVKDIFAVS